MIQVIWLSMYVGNHFHQGTPIPTHQIQILPACGRGLKHQLLNNYNESVRTVLYHNWLPIYYFFIKIPRYLSIRMQHWRPKATDGAEFWISCKRPAFLRTFSRLQMIQNKRPWCCGAAYVEAGLRSSDSMKWNYRVLTFIIILFFCSFFEFQDTIKFFRN